MSEYLLKRVKRLKREVLRIGRQTNEQQANLLILKLTVESYNDEMSTVKGRITRLHNHWKEVEQAMTAAADRIEVALTGISGDLAGLKDAAAALQARLDEALADQGEATQAAVTTAVADARAAFDTQLDALATRLEGIDGETAPVEDPTPAPADPEVPVEDQPAEPTPGPVEPEPVEDPQA